MTSRETYGIKDSAVCRFCECWCHRDKDGEAVNGARRKCRRTTKNNHCNFRFRSDNICGHMTKQHPINFVEYAASKSKSGIKSVNLRGFFEQSAVDAFFEKRSTIIGIKRM